MNRIKQLFKTAESRNGSFSLGVVAIVIGIIVVLNLIIGQLPENIRNIDISSNKIYEISDTSTTMLDSLDKKITFTVLADKDGTDDRIKTFLSKYTALSNKISVEWIDPVLHPSALTEYNTTSSTIVVACADTDKSTTISFDDIIVTDEMSAYYYGTASETEFDGEGQLTSAINYVTSEVTHTIYRTTGHGEATFSTSLSDMIAKANYTVSEANLVMDAAIPDDCDLLIMNAPTTDLSEDEATAISDYLADGGKVMVLLGDTEAADVPNLSSILKVYGLEQADGYIADTSRCYQGNYYYLFPELSVSGDMADGISSQMVMMINSHGFDEVDPARDTITETPFMTTSSNGYAVKDDNTMAQGTYVMGAVSTEDTDNGTARLTVISSASMIDSQITDAMPTLENTTLFMNAVTSNFDGVTNISVEAKSLTAETNTIQNGGMYSMLFILVIPLLVLISGFVVWFRRRKA